MAENSGLKPAIGCKRIAKAQATYRRSRRRGRRCDLKVALLTPNYSPAGIGAIHVFAVSGRGLFSPPAMTIIRSEIIAADGASTCSGISPTTRQESAFGSYSRIVLSVF